MTTKITYTHAGWFGLCPVYIAAESNNGVEMIERYKFTSWLFDFSEWMFILCNKIKEWFYPDWEWIFPVQITAEVEPFTVGWDDE